MVLWAVLFLLQHTQIYDLPAAERNPFTSAGDVALGQKLYAGRCAGCHGPGGDGGKGANLAVPVLPRAVEDRSLYKVIRYGIAETEMPSFNLTEKEVWQISAFVRTLGRISRESLNGDPARGLQLVRGKGGCLQCHAIGTEGGHLGPPLTDIGSRRGPGHLRDKLLDPVATVPEDFRLVELTANGQKISGVRLNEDTWSIQIRDFAGRLHSFWKEDVRDLRIERRTPMPSYKGRLDTQEVTDVLVYLTSLRGEQ
jgi:putative heme-binding domain-containing protein